MKRIKDTTVIYNFHENTMTQKAIIIKGADTTAIFTLLTSLGFERKHITGNLFPFFENSIIRSKACASPTQELAPFFEFGEETRQFSVPMQTFSGQSTETAVFVNEFWTARQFPP